MDGGSTEFLGTELQAAGLSKIPNGGFDTTGSSLPNIKAGLTDFIIYQDPYLQGFLPAMYMYLFNLSGGTVVPPDTDTGLSFIEKSSLGNYQVSSRFQGQTTQKLYQAPGRGHPERAGHHQHLRHDADGRMALPATGEGRLPSAGVRLDSGGLASPSRAHLRWPGSRSTDVENG